MALDCPDAWSKYMSKLGCACFVCRNRMVFVKMLLLICFFKHSNSIQKNSLSNNQQQMYPNLSPFPTNYFKETVKHFVNNRPIIGVVAMKMKGGKTLTEYPALRGQDYFGASFVKWMESIGGRVVPIPEVCSALWTFRRLNLLFILKLSLSSDKFSKIQVTPSIFYWVLKVNYFSNKTFLFAVIFLMWSVNFSDICYLARLFE